MKLLHYTSNKIDKLKPSDQKGFKPVGLWLSVNNEWEVWCQENGFYKYNYDNCWIHEFSINESANILLIQNTDDFEIFTNKYYNNYNKLE